MSGVAALFSKSCVMDIGLAPEEAMWRLASVTGMRCGFCRTMLRMSASARFCSLCGQPLDNPLAGMKPQADGGASGPVQFQGRVSKTGFQITPVRTWQNSRSVTPIVTGAVQPAAAGTRIVMVMRPDDFALIFGLLFTCGGVLIFLILLTEGGPRGTALIPLFMATCAFVALKLSFAMEVSSARQRLELLWQARSSVPGSRSQD